MTIASREVLAGLRRGAATLDALAARTGADRETLVWALDEARERGWVVAPAQECGPDGLCASSAPAVYTLTPAGARALERRG